MHGSRSKIPSKNIVRQRYVDGFNSDVRELNNTLARSNINILPNCIEAL
jgi:hypothetical protein